MDARASHLASEVLQIHVLAVVTEFERAPAVSSNPEQRRHSSRIDSQGCTVERVEAPAQLLSHVAPEFVVSITARAVATMMACGDVFGSMTTAVHTQTYTRRLPVMFVHAAPLLVVLKSTSRGIDNYDLRSVSRDRRQLRKLARCRSACNRRINPSGCDAVVGVVGVPYGSIVSTHPDGVRIYASQC